MRILLASVSAIGAEGILENHVAASALAQIVLSFVAFYIWLAGYQSPLGLLAEELDTETGQHLGKFPQAFSHLALSEAARCIIMIERLLEFV